MANLNFNKVILAGRITDTPVLQVKDGRDPMTHFDIAISRRYGGRNGEEHVMDFPRIVAWGKNAEMVCETFEKGASVCVVGNLRTRSYTKNEERRFSTEVIAEEIYPVDSKAEARAAIKKFAEEQVEE